MIKTSTHVFALLFFTLLSCGEEKETPVVIPEVSFDGLVTNCNIMPSDNYTSIQFSTLSMGYAISATGAVYKTEDSCESWIQQNSQTDEPLTDLDFFDQNHGYIVGGSKGNGVIIHTTDGGEEWSILNLSVPDNLKAVYALNSEVAFCGGQSILLRTIDGGKDWIEQTIDGSYFFINDINFFDSNVGLISGTKLLRTVDGGVTWVELGFSANGDIQILDEQIAFVYDSQASSIYKTIDQGKTWTQIRNAPPLTSCYYFVDESRAIAAGQMYPPKGFFPYGILYATTDGGKNWSSKIVEIPQFYAFRGVSANSSNSLYLVGDTYSGCVSHFVFVE